MCGSWLIHQCIAICESELDQHLKEIRKILKRPSLSYVTVSGIEVSISRCHGPGSLQVSRGGPGARLQVCPATMGQNELVSPRRNWRCSY